MVKRETIIDISQEYRELKSDRAKDALNLYGAILKINNGFSAIDFESSVRTASYIVYAFLGGHTNQNNGEGD